MTSAETKIVVIALLILLVGFFYTRVQPYPTGSAYIEDVMVEDGPDISEADISFKEQKSYESLLPNEPQIVSAQGSELPDGYQPPAQPTTTVVTHLWDAFALGGISSTTFTQPKIVDLDGDGRQEIVAALMLVDPLSVQQGIYVWDGSGNLKQGFPVLPIELQDPLRVGRLSIVGVGDVVGNSNLEIVAATGTGVYVISSTGQVISRILPGVSFSGVADKQRAVIVPDINGDGKSEIMVQSYGDYTIFLFDGNGQSLHGWPITLGGTYCGFFSQPAVVDFFDGRGLAFLVNVDPRCSPGPQPRIIAYNRDGTVRWSFLLPGFKAFPPIVGDVNGDGWSEIVTGTIMGRSGPFDFIDIIILDRNGIQLARWSTQVSTAFSISLGDLDNDKILEIVYSSSDDSPAAATYVEVRDYQGNTRQGFPRRLWDGHPQGPTIDCPVAGTDQPYCNPSRYGIADIDGDGYQDIYTIARNSFRTGRQGDHIYALFAFDRLGNTLTGFPFQLLNYQSMSGVLTYMQYSSPTVADINQDGTLDIVVSKGFGRMEAATFNTPIATRRIPPRERECYPQTGSDSYNTEFVSGCPLMTRA